MYALLFKIQIIDVLVNLGGLLFAGAITFGILCLIAFVIGSCEKYEDEDENSAALFFKWGKRFFIFCFITAFANCLTPSKDTAKLAKVAVTVDFAHGLLKDSETFNKIEGNLSESLVKISNVILGQAKEWSKDLNQDIANKVAGNGEKSNDGKKGGEVENGKS